ncbi:D-tagatose 3-epimerase [Pseudobythopirellula maris]|uniref:D-tagatose 3-epimerase n=1 Tax=Pseudobythopirellula maris TaxID=2527991 RepID=A0A5C5ZPI7_9BACT|nr:sugar phosphate isomerase/epimerase family protein [Pseudobythopirellula maris]TWT88797.1 D-tagatose 3-epimerase [Pseudobythopirellula maris]
MPRYALCNETYQDAPLDEAFKDMSDAGYQGVEIAPYTLCEDPTHLTEERGAEIARMAADHGVEVIGLHWLLVKPEGLHLTTPDRMLRAKTAAFAGHLAKVCAAMGGKVMVWGSPKAREVLPGEDRLEAMKRAAEVLHGVCETAGPLGVTIAFEPLGPAETNFVTTAAEGVELCKLVDHPACKLHLDVKAMASEVAPGKGSGEAIAQIVRDNKEWLAHFHANDPNLRGPGQGEVDFKPIASALEEIEYGGWVSVEVFDYTPDPATIARQSMACLRESFSAG